MFDRCFGCMRPLEFPDAPCPHCGYDGRATPFDRNHLPPGTVLQNRYVLGRALGLGSFGNTYIGWDTQAQMRVTVKEFLPGAVACHRADTPTVQFYSAQGRALFEKGMRLFCEETATLRGIENAECINPILDVVEENGTAYTVAQYWSGQTLKAYLAEYRAMSFDDAMAIMAPVLRTLDTVHQNGLLHRDISPDNLFLCSSGEVRILDFGLAQFDLAQENTDSLSVLFKPGFAPPEQYARHILTGPWTDVFGAAATLYKMITGIAPPDVPQRQREDTLLPPHDLECDIPDSAEKALLRALSLRPEDRYATADAFLRALESDAQTTTSETPKKRTLRILLPVLCVLLLLGVVTGIAIRFSRRDPKPKTDGPTNVPAQTQTEPAGLSSDAVEVTYYEDFTPQSMEVVRTQNGDAAALPYTVFVQNGGRGLVSGTGEIVLPAQYNTIVWDNTVGAFLLDSKQYWDVSAGTFTPAEPAAPRPGGDLRTSVYTYDASNQLLRTDGGRSFAQTTGEGSFLIGTGPYGIVTRGTLLVEPTCRKATPLSCGIAAFYADGQWTYRNAYGVDVFGKSFPESVFPGGVPFSYSDGLVPFFDEDAGRWGYADTAGKTSVPAAFITALPSVHSEAWVQTEEGFGTIALAEPGETLRGRCGENAQYQYTPQTGLLEIDGYGSLWDFTADNIPWLSFAKQIRTVRITGDIDYLGAGSFNDCTALTGVTVTGSLRAVGPFAFAGCGNLRMVTAAESLETIGDLAFAGCTALAELPTGGVTTIGAYAFSGSGLEHVALPQTSAIAESAFESCPSLQTADLSGAVRIGAGAFASCTALQTVVLPKTMQSIGSSAFDGCTSLESVRVPPGVSALETQTFRGCTALSSVTLPDGLHTIGAETFAGCASLGGISLPPTLKTIGSRAFDRCTGLENVLVPDSVSDIGSYAFAGCTGVTLFELKDTVTTLGAYAFDGWTSGQTIRIKNILLKRLLGTPPGWDKQWNANCSAQIESA